MMTSIPLVVLFAAAALFSLYELIRFRSGPQVESYIADREAQATHLLMNGGMAAMVSPFYGAAIERVILIAFAAGMLVLAVRLVVLAWGRGGNRAAGTVYHLIGLAAMLYATRLMSSGMTMHGGGMMQMAPAPTNWLAIALAVLFALDGIATLVLAGFMPTLLLRMEASVGGAAPSSLAVIRASAFPHVVMDFGMVLMLLPIL